MFTLPYGTAHVSFSLPVQRSADTIIYPGANTSPIDGMAVLEAALAAPVGSPPLAELARGKRSAVLLISDGSRLAPSRMFLPLLLRELAAGGLTDDRVTIVVALGMHRKHTEDELVRLVGADVYRRVRVVNHSAQPEDCVAVGTTQRGTPVEINRLVHDAELRVATGNIEPHALVGVSGGVKALVPGVASRTTIERNHALSQSYKAQPGDPDNPIHRDLEDAQRLVPIHFLFNVIVNHKQEPLAAVAGEVAEAHRSGVEQARRLFLVPAEPLYDLVVVSPGGYPKDMQLYQSVKTLRNAAAFAKPGGTLVMAARCEEGFGSGTLQYWVETMPDREAIKRKLQEQFVLGAHKMEHIDQLLQNYRIYLLSDMSRPQVELTGFTPVDDLQDTLDRLVAGAAPLEIAVMPYGGMTYPYRPDN